ncbi:MAG: tetratricopeptide repeat protein, partial [Candidatus Caldatribacteriota bacterium]|nr:tetratricopeptide repeat protein [Candidatus Caldatribacteriota bacterium]
MRTSKKAADNFLGKINILGVGNMRLYGILLIVLMTLMIASCTPPNVDRNIGRAYLGEKDYDAAISEFKKAVSKEPYNVYNHFWLGKAYYDKGRYKDAVTHLKKATELQPNNAYHLLMLGNAYMKTQQYQDAIVALKKAIGIEPTESVFLRELSYCYIKVQNYDEAITVLKRVIELNPDSDTAYNNLGYVYGKKKQYDKAFKAFRKAIVINPQDPTLYSNYGHFLSEKRDCVGAAEQYKKAASLQPTNWTYLSKLADAYYKQGRCDDAIEAANKAIGLNAIGLGPYIFIEDNYPIVKAPTTLTPTLRAGLESAKRAGIETGDRIIKINGQLTEGWSIEKAIKSVISSKYVNITIQRKGLDMPIEKVIKKESIISQEASNPLALRSLALIEKGKHEEAYKDAEHAYSLNSSDGWAQLALGASNLDQGRYDEAIKLLSQVKGSNTARILEATAYARKGDFKRAVDIYSAIPEEKLSPENVPLWSDRTA